MQGPEAPTPNHTPEVEAALNMLDAVRAAIESGAVDAEDFVAGADLATERLNEQARLGARQSQEGLGWRGWISVTHPDVVVRQELWRGGERYARQGRGSGAVFELGAFATMVAKKADQG